MYIYIKYKLTFSHRGTRISREVQRRKRTQQSCYGRLVKSIDICFLIFKIDLQVLLLHKCSKLKK